jgi:lactate racemase
LSERWSSLALDQSNPFDVTMTEINLRFGDASIPFNYDNNQFQLLARDETAPPLTDVEINDRLSAPIDSPPLEELFSADDSVLIVVSDATRATASAQVVNLLVRRLIQSGVSPAELAIVFSTGIHRAVTPEEKVELLTSFIAQRVRTLDHSAADYAKLAIFETSDHGTPVELNSSLTSFAKVVVTGAIGFHYFAGFTGGRKSICPGLASARTIEATHMLALDFETGGRRAGVGIGLLDGNAVHEECERIARLINPSFSINSVVDERGRAVKIYAGDWRSAHRAGCVEYLESHSVEIEQKREVVIVSCGGSPYDINLIQAHKALEMASHAVTDGGTIVLVAQCRDGLGRPDFLKWFAEKDARALAERLRDGYEVNGQTAWSLMTKTESYRVLLVSALPDEEVRNMRMTPARSLTEAIGQVPGGRRGYIMPHGARFLPRCNVQTSNVA